MIKSLSLPLLLLMAGSPALSKGMWVTVFSDRYWGGDRHGNIRAYQVDLDSIRIIGDEVYARSRILVNEEWFNRNIWMLKADCRKNEFQDTLPQESFSNHTWVRQSNGHWHWRGSRWMGHDGIERSEKELVAKRRSEANNSARFDFLCKAWKP